MNARKVSRSYQFGEVLVDNSYFKKGYVFTMSNDMLKLWKIGQNIPVSDSWCEPVMIPAKDIRAFIVEDIRVETNILRDQ